MNEKGEFRSHARPGHHALISSCGKRRSHPGENSRDGRISG
jgi:hypothetical protein